MLGQAALLALFAVVFLAALVGLAALHLRYWVARLTLPLDYAIEEELVTDDGARVAIRRLPSSKEPAIDPGAKALPPVLLVHGLGANHRNQDIHPDYSLARYLAAFGRDVWLLTLRTGLSMPGRMRRLQRFEAMARHDLPLGVREVLRQSGSRELDYIGFSMGGMLLYAALGRGIDRASVRRVVIVGSPGRIRVTWPLRSLARVIPRALAPRMPLKFWARMTAFASEWMRTPFHRLFVNPFNMSPGLTRTSLVNCIEDVPGALVADFAEWACGDGEIRVDGDRVIDGLAELDVPALFVAGAADHLGPPDAVRHAFDAWGRNRPGTPKKFLLLGQESGHRENYGHGDLALGAHVGVELFPDIERFLKNANEESGP